MSQGLAGDFLSTLVDRALSRAPVIERRRPSLFEPADGGGQLSVPLGGRAEFFPEDVQVSEESDSEAVETREAPVARPAAPLRRNRSAVAASPNSATPAERIETEANRDPPRNAGTPAETNTTHAAPDPVTRAAESLDHEEETVAPAVRVRKAPPVEEPAAEESVVPKPAAPVTVMRPRTKRGDPENETAGESGARENRSQPAPLRPLDRFLPPPPQPAARAFAQPVRGPNGIGREVLREPTIHVTIGRIEIRATTGQAPAPRAARTAGPKLDLDDYLKSRGGASR
jgi:hypothetical protein